MSREIGYQIRENKAGTQKMIYHYKRGAERKNCWTYKLDCQRGSEKLATQGKVKESCRNVITEYSDLQYNNTLNIGLPFTGHDQEPIILE